MRTRSGVRDLSRSRAAVALLLAMALVIAGCGGGDDGDTAVGGDVGVRDNGDGGSGGGDGGGGGGNGEGEGESGPPVPGGPGDPGQAQAEANEGQERRDDIPAVGRYTYQLTFAGSDGDDRRFLDVETTVGGGDYVRQLYTIHHGGDSAVRQLVSWRAGADDGMWVEFEQKARGADVGQMCAWDPQYRHLRYPLKAGDEETVESRCQGWENGSKSRTHTVRVVGQRQLEIDGRTLEAWEIERVTESVQRIETGNIAIIERVEATELWWRDRSLLLRSEERYTNSVNGVPRQTGARTALLTALDPEPIRRG